MRGGADRNERIVLMLDHRENRRLLREMLQREFRVDEGGGDGDLRLPFDLLIVDGPMLDRHWERIEDRRRSEETVFLPVLLITGRHDVGLVTRHLWRSCDEVVFTPIEKIELRARIEILLRARRYSLQAVSRYYTLAESSPVGIFLLRKGLAVWTNPALASIVHGSRADLRNSPLTERLHPGDREAARDRLDRAQRGEIPDRMTVRLTTPAGVRWGELYAVPLPDEAEPTVLGLLADVTRSREAERLKDAFLATAAHELKTPITAILGFSEYLLQDPLTPPPQRELLDPIYRQGEALARIVDDLLELSRLQAGGSIELDRVPFDLRKTATETVEPFRREHPDRQYAVENPAEPVPVVADREKLALAVRKLLSNAVKFSPPGSRVRVSVRREGGACRLSVEDEGVGMTPDQVEKTKELFYRADTSHTAVGGFGLGLAMARRIVAAHGGVLEIESAPGRGTRVTLSLPEGG